MRRHEITVAVLHALAALFVAGCVTLLWVAAAGLAPLVAGSFIPDLIAAVGRPVAVFLLTMAAIDGLGACRVIARPASRARRILLVFAVLLLPVFPIGTCLAIYTWWGLRWGARPAAPSAFVRPVAAIDDARDLPIDRR